MSNPQKQRLLEGLKLRLMIRYCPEFEARMPKDEPGDWYAEAIVAYGYWGNKYRVVASKKVAGLRQAYITARWLALKAQWLRPAWLFSCGINYGVRAVTAEVAAA